MDFSEFQVSKLQNDFWLTVTGKEMAAVKLRRPSNDLAATLHV